MIAELPSYPKVKDCGIPWFGAVPVHWTLRRLRSTVLGCINGIWGDDANGKEDDLACVRVADFDRHRRRVRRTIPTQRSISHDERRRRLLTRGDLLLEKSGGGDQQPVGVVVLYDQDTPAVCSNFIARMPVHPDHNARYLTYLHAYMYSRGINLRSIKQTTGIQNLDSSAYLREKVPLPPRTEQDAIARFLAHVDNRISRSIGAKQKLLNLLDEQKQVIVHHAVTQGLDPGVTLAESGVDGFGKMPAHWEVRRAKFLFQALDKRSETGEEELLTVSARRGVVPRSSETVTMFMAESYVGHKLCWPEDLVINSLWAWARGLGFSPHHGIVSTAYGVYRLRSQHRSLWRYLDYALRSPAYEWQFNVRSKGIWKSRLQLTDWAFLEMPIVLPMADEAQRIVEHIEQATSDVTRAAERASREITLLLEYRARVIAELVTGQRDARSVAIDLPDPAQYEKEPDEVETADAVPDDVDNIAVLEEAEA